jgi:hypothetical protein
MKIFRYSMLLVMTMMVWGAVPLLAASNYFEGWDAGTIAGWSRSTINTEVFGDAAAGNPAGSLRIVPLNTAEIALVGALTMEPAATGDYAAAGIRRVSFDLTNQSVPVTDFWFHVRYLDEFHNGWAYRLATSIPQGQWTSYVVEFDPTWSDAEAVAAGWMQESLSPSFATTMSAVYYPELRFRVSPVSAGAELHLDNFRLMSCNNDNEPPTGAVNLDRNTLWPPTHKMVDVFAAVVKDDFCDPNPTVTLVGVTSNEPDEGLAGGDRPNDIEILSKFNFRLRSERDSHGDGRQYTITYSIEDGSGNAATISAVVTVPVSLTPAVLAGAAAASGASGERAFSEGFVLHIPSRPKGLDAAKIDLASVQAGNHLGVVSPTASFLEDVNGDALPDLTVVFPTAPLDELSRRAGAELWAELTQDPSWDGSIPLDEAGSLVGLHFMANGVSYVTDDLTSNRLLQRPLVGVGDGGGELQPAATSGALQFRLPQAGYTNVVVFDVQGRRIRTLLDGQASAGLVQLVWDRRDDTGLSVPSGMYFVRIAGPGLQDVRKMALAR